MAKAGRKSTPIDEAVGAANDARVRKLQAEIDERLKQLAQSEWFRDAWERWVRARAEEAELAKARKKASESIGRAIAIEAGLIAPPWVSELTAQLKPPATPANTLDGVVSSKVWIADEVGRMKTAGEIPPGATRVELAKDLARRMVKAAETNRSIRPLKWTSIKSNILVGDLWKSIK